MKTLVIQSDSPDSDRKAAFTIMEECRKNPDLKKITWFSNISKLVTGLENRFDQVEAMLKGREEQFKMATQAALKAAERVRVLEANYNSLNRDLEDVTKWIREQKKSNRKETAKSAKEAKDE